MMKRYLVLATAGAGGDLQPLIAAALGLIRRGHELSFLGDQSVAAALAPLGLDSAVVGPEHDLGPRIISAVRGSMGLPEALRGDYVRDRLDEWAQEIASVLQGHIAELHPDALVTSLFGAGVAHLAASGRALPWAVINSTFYVGPNPPRPLELDLHPRAVPLFRDSLVPFLEHANLVLHATDPVFDYEYNNLPARHHYVGPLIWEAAGERPSYLDEPGYPWVLVTISSQLQDDLPLARAALDALADRQIRLLVTVGPGHGIEELGPLPRNAKVEEYVPHGAALECSRLLVSHAGHGSVMKALWYGVPMVLVPWGRDQPGVAARAEHLGVARVIPREQLSAGALSDAVMDALESRAMMEAARESMRRLRETDPVALACDYLEQLG